MTSNPFLLFVRGWRSGYVLCSIAMLVAAGIVSTEEQNGNHNAGASYVT